MFEEPRTDDDDGFAVDHKVYECFEFGLIVRFLIVRSRDASGSGLSGVVNGWFDVLLMELIEWWMGNLKLTWFASWKLDWAQREMSRWFWKSTETRKSQLAASNDATKASVPW